MSKQIVKEFLQQKGFEVAQIEISHYQVSDQERIFALIEISNIEKNEEFFEKYHGKEFTEDGSVTLRFHLIPQAKKIESQANAPELMLLIPSQGEIKQLNSIMLVGVSHFISSKELLYSLTQKPLSFHPNKVLLFTRENFLNEKYGVIYFQNNKDAIEAKTKLNKRDQSLRKILGKEYQGALVADPYLTHFKFNPLVGKRCSCLRLKDFPLTHSSGPLYKQLVNQINKIITLSKDTQDLEEQQSLDEDVKALIHKLRRTNLNQQNSSELKITAIRIYQNRNAFIFFNQPIPKSVLNFIKQDLDFTLQIKQNTSILASSTQSTIKECKMDLAQRKPINPKEYYSQPYNLNTSQLSDYNKNILLNGILKKEHCSGLALKAKNILERLSKKNQSTKFDQRPGYKRKDRSESIEREDELQKRQKLNQGPQQSILQQPPIPPLPQMQQQFAQLGNQFGALNQQFLQQMQTADPNQIQNLQMSIQSILSAIQQGQLQGQMQGQMYPGQGYNNQQQQNNYRY